MARITFIPGVIAFPAAITIPTYAPDIDIVQAAEITRVPGAIDDHPAHNHDFALLAGKGGGAGTAAVVGDTTPSIGGVTATMAGVNAATEGGVLEGALMAHVGTNPVVAAVPTRLTARTLSLDVDTVLGDLLTLDYTEVGGRVLVA